jgi:hypothetical protein
MNSDLRAQIRNRMQLKETDELREIWQTNDHLEWSDNAFEVVEEILKERGVDLPEQNEPLYEHREDAKQKEDYGFSDEELKIIDDENPPAFYDPFEALLTTKWIDWMAKAMIVFTVVYNAINFRTPLEIIRSYFFAWGNPNSPLVYILTALFLALNAAINIIVIYFPLKALAHILRILMEMEFRSRKGTQSNPVVE